MVLGRKKIFLAILALTFLLTAFSATQAKTLTLAKHQKKIASERLIKPASAELGLKIPTEDLSITAPLSNDNKAAQPGLQAESPPTTPVPGQPQTPAEPSPVVTPAPPPVQVHASDKQLPANQKEKEKPAARQVAAQDQEIALNFPVSRALPKALEKSTLILMPPVNAMQLASAKSPYATDAFSPNTTRILNSIAVLMGLLGLWLYVLSLPAILREKRENPLLSYAE